MHAPLRFSLPASITRISTKSHTKSINIHDQWPEENLTSTINERGGFYPTRLGETFEEGRFVITRKLGWGGFSSVWLARDRMNNRHIALKILSAYASKEAGAGRIRESQILPEMAVCDPSHHGFPHVLLLLDRFTFKSCAGQHLCFATEPLSFDVTTLKSYVPDGRLPLKLILYLVEDVLKGLEYLHDKCGIVHSDLKPANILLRPFDIDEIIMHELAEHPSTLYKFPQTISPDDLPVHPVASAPLPYYHKPDKGRRLHWVISDFGEAHFANKPLIGIVQPYALRAPEVIFGLKWGPPIDIWSLGCLMYEFALSRWLFSPKCSEDLPVDIDHLVQITQRTGQHHNETLLQQYALKNEIKDITSMLERATAKNDYIGPIESEINESTVRHNDSQELAAFIQLMRSFLALDPTKRPSAANALRNSIFKNLECPT